jgi:hypothetical protein
MLGGEIERLDQRRDAESLRYSASAHSLPIALSQISCPKVSVAGYRIFNDQMAGRCRAIALGKG